MNPMHILCKGKAGRDNRHIAGSFQCPEFRMTGMKNEVYSNKSITTGSLRIYLTTPTINLRCKLPSLLGARSPSYTTHHKWVSQWFCVNGRKRCICVQLLRPTQFHIVLDWRHIRQPCSTNQKTFRKKTQAGRGPDLCQPCTSVWYMILTVVIKQLLSWVSEP